MAILSKDQDVSRILAAYAYRNRAKDLREVMDGIHLYVTKTEFKFVYPVDLERVRGKFNRDCIIENRV